MSNPAPFVQKVKKQDVIDAHSKDMLTQKQIAAKFGITPTYVHKILKDARMTRLRNKHVDPERIKIERIEYNLCNTDRSYTEIATSLGTNRNLVAKVAKRIGKERKQPEKRPPTPSAIVDVVNALNGNIKSTIIGTFTAQRIDAECEMKTLEAEKVKLIAATAEKNKRIAVLKSSIKKIDTQLSML